MAAAPKIPEELPAWWRLGPIPRNGDPPADPTLLIQEYLKGRVTPGEEIELAKAEINLQKAVTQAKMEYLTALGQVIERQVR
jgi:hypothetical protein